MKKKEPNVTQLCSRALERISVPITALFQVKKKMEAALSRGLSEDDAVKEVREFAQTL
jgi:hypothetical protein